MRCTPDRFLDFRKQVWPFLRGYIEERIEAHRELLEIGPDGRGAKTRDTDDMLRGRNLELRTLIEAVENDEMLLSDLYEMLESRKDA